MMVRISVGDARTQIGYVPIDEALCLLSGHGEAKMGGGRAARRFPDRQSLQYIVHTWHTVDGIVLQNQAQ